MLRAFRRIRRDTLGFLVDARATYGDVVQFPIPGRTVLLVSDPAAVARVLQENHRAYTKRTVQYTSLAAVTGEGLLTADGEPWRTQRRLVQPAFHHSTLESVAGHTATAAGEVAAAWGAAAGADGAAVVDVDASMMQAALEVVGRSLLGADLRGDAERVVSAVLQALSVVVARARTPVPVPRLLPTPGNRTMARSLRTIDATVRRVVAGHRAGGVGDDLLGLLLAARDEGRGLSDAAVRDEVVTMVVAGHETVASALTWTWMLLAEHPDVQARVAAEAREVLGDGPVAADQLGRLSLARRVVEESLRLYPPAWVLSRRAVEPDRLAGVGVPRGALVIISPYVVHRHPSVWRDPETFDPQRFSPRRAGQPVDAPREAYLPFGAGPRLCVGRDFALVEATLMLAQLARDFEVRTVPAHEVAVDALVTLRPRGGLPLRVVRR